MVDVATTGSHQIEFGIMEIAGDDFFRWAWGGLVVLMGGVIMLLGAVKSYDIRQFAKVTLGALMVLMIAATDLFARFCESIPAGEDSPDHLVVSSAGSHLLIPQQSYFCLSSWCLYTWR